MSEVQHTVRDAINRLKTVNALGKTNLSDKGVDLPGEENTTYEVVDGIEQIETGSSLNIAFSQEAPEDTSMLWVKTAQPQNVTVDYNPDNTVETVSALSAVLPTATGDVAYGTVGKKTYLFPYNKSIMCFDEETNSVTQTGTIYVNDHTAAGVVGNNIYLFGGVNGSTFKNTIIKYDTTTNTLQTMSAVLPQGVDMASCAVVGAKCYVFGGNTDYSNIEVNTISVYDTDTDTLTTLSTTLPSAARFVGVGAIGTKIYLFGGRAGTSTIFNTISVFDTVTNTISTLPITFPTPCAQQSVITYGSKCYLLGGLVTSGGSRVSVDTIYVFDAETETLTLLSNTLPQPMFGVNVGITENGAFLIGGGSTQLGNVPLDTIYKFNITFPLAEGNVFIQEDMLRNKFTLVTAPTEVKTGVSAVYVGNASNEAESAEALLYDGAAWQPIV